MFEEISIQSFRASANVHLTTSEFKWVTRVVTRVDVEFTGAQVYITSRANLKVGFLIMEADRLRSL